MVKIESKPLRYAHTEGHTDICFTEDGQQIITCGHDGDVRIWMGIEDDDPNSHCVGESAIAVCFKDKRLYVGTDSHAVQAYTFPAFDKDGIVTRFTAPVTQIVSSSKIEALGCSSENMEAKICSSEGGAPLFIMSEHKGPVLGIAICPQMKYASTSCGDGMLRVWDIDTQKIVKEINCVPKINTFFAAKVLCRMDFQPSDGKMFAYPNNREIVLLDCDSWGQRMSFTHSSIKCAISQCIFSPCGQYLAGSTVAGQIAVWDVGTGHCMGFVDHPTSHNVTGMVWNPKGNGVLAYCDMAGQLGMLVNCCGKKSSEGDDDDGDIVEMIERTEDNTDLVDDLIERYESDDDNGVSLEKLKNETLGLLPSESRPPSRGEVLPVSVPPQPPFQPSATPDHLEHRYMCWNDVGIVRSHTTESGESSIDVEFHDTNLHHAIHLNNYLNHTMASLSATVLALACETPSKLVCISLIGSSKEWSVSMTETEEILCIVATSGIVACATTARFLRIFTPMGTQRQVISLPGPAVALSGFNTTVLAVYHSSEPGVSDQHLAMDIIAFNGRQVRSKTVPLPLTPSSKLSWIGTSDVGSPCSYDNTGVLRLYDLSSGVWMPICDMNNHSKGASDSWFIVSISESTQMIRGILCRGASFPLTVPKPIITELPIQIPLCELDTEKGQYEEQLVRWAHTTAEVEVKTARETALKLFALACRSEIEQRALELMELLRDDKLLPLAARYASRLGRIHLTEKLTDLAEIWERDSDRLNTNIPQNSHFQDLDSQEVYDVNSTECHNESLILPQRKEKVESVVPIKPVPILSGARNPFKKQQQTMKNVQSPLSLTDRSLVEIQNSHQTEENTDPSQPKENETFIDWYTRNKSSLEIQHPELTPSELSKTAIRTFKSLQTKSGTVNGAESQKRKLEEIAPSTQEISAPTKQQKLSAFAFQKKS